MWTGVYLHTLRHIMYIKPLQKKKIHMYVSLLGRDVTKRLVERCYVVARVSLGCC